MAREHVVTVTLKDCDVQTFCAGGNGGSNQNAKQTGVRIIHRASNAVGEARDSRYQLQNKKAAFHRMSESLKFKQWAHQVAGMDELPDRRSSAYVRTYNLVDKRVKDHRTGEASANVEAVLNGELDVLT